MWYQYSNKTEGMAWVRKLTAINLTSVVYIKPWKQHVRVSQKNMHVILAFSIQVEYMVLQKCFM